MAAPRNEPMATIAERPIEAEMAPDVVSSFMTSGAGESGQAIIVQALTPFSVQVQVLHPSEDRNVTPAQYIPSSQVVQGSVQAIMVQASGASPPEQVL